MNAATTKEEVPQNLVVLFKEAHTHVIDGVVIYPGITVVPAVKASSLVSNVHFKAQLKVGSIEIIQGAPIVNQEDGVIAQKQTTLTGDHDIDQASAIMATPQATALKAIQGNLNIPVLKKVAKNDPRSAVKLAASQKVEELIKPEVKE